MITWNLTGGPNVKLEYSKNGTFTDAVTIVASAANGANGCTVPGGASGCYPWTIPDAIATTVKVRVTDTSNGALTDNSDLAFTIAGTVTVTAPNGGQTFTVKGTIAAQSPTPGMVAGQICTVGNSAMIAWATTGSMANVKLEYSVDNFATSTVIVASTPNTGTYSWTIPDVASATVKVR